MPNCYYSRLPLEPGHYNAYPGYLASGIHYIGPYADGDKADCVADTRRLFRLIVPTDPKAQVHITTESAFPLLPVGSVIDFT